MKKLMILLILFLLNLTGIQTVFAVEYTAPTAPSSAEYYMPEETESFSDGLLHILKKAVLTLQPNIAEAGKVCVRILAITILVSITKGFCESAKKLAELIAIICVSIILVRSSDTMIQLGTRTVTEISEYGKLLLPVMTAALTAQGGINSSAAIYTSTAVFSAILSSLIGKVLIPGLYIYIVLSIGFRAVGEDLLKNLRDFMKWLIVWGLKIILYVFTGFLTVSGVISGSTDAVALKAAKLTISGVVPVVGNIISDASETILVSAGIFKNAAGVYGLLAITAMCIGPFLKIGIQYIILKSTAAICGGFGTDTAGIMKDFATVMGILVGMIGAVCLLFLVSIVCYLRGVA